MIEKFAQVRTATLTGAAVALFVFAGCHKAPPAAQQGPLPVNVVAASEQEVQEWDEFTGRTEAVESVDVRARVTGYLQSVNFKAGETVQRGALLFVIDPRPYQADLDRAAANLEQTEAQLKLAQIDFDRAKDLRQKKVVSPEEFDQKSAGLQQAEAAVRSSQAAKDAAALNLDFTQIKSPITGRVSNERVTVGNLVQSSSGSEGILTTVVSIDPIYVYADADENSVLKFLKLREEGKRKSAQEERIPAFIQFANEEGFPHEGYIDFVDNRIDSETGTLRVRAVFKSWDDLLSPGFFVRMRVPAGEKKRAVLIPDKVISSQQGVKYAFIVKPDNTIERRNLETGGVHEGKRIVIKGLKDGEKVVSTRLQIVQPGMPVTPVMEKEEAAPAETTTKEAAPAREAAEPTSDVPKAEAAK